MSQVYEYQKVASLSLRTDLYFDVLGTVNLVTGYFTVEPAPDENRLFGVLLLESANEDAPRYHWNLE